VTGAVLALLSDIHHVRRAGGDPQREIVRRQPVEPLQRQSARAPGVEPAEQVPRDAVEAGPSQLDERLVEVVRRLEDEDDLAVGRHHRTHPRPERRLQGDPERPTWPGERAGDAVHDDDVVTCGVGLPGVTTTRLDGSSIRWLLPVERRIRFQWAGRSAGRSR
jgi:hypothetical protein